MHNTNTVRTNSITQILVMSNDLFLLHNVYLLFIFLQYQGSCSSIKGNSCTAAVMTLWCTNAWQLQDKAIRPLYTNPWTVLPLGFYPPLTLAKSCDRKVLILIHAQCCGCISAIKIPTGSSNGSQLEIRLQRSVNSNVAPLIGCPTGDGT